MTAVVWVVPGLWQACVEVASRLPDGRDVLLVAAADDEAASVAAGVAGGLLGRGRPRTAEAAIDQLSRRAAEDLLADAAAALGRPCRTQVLSGRAEQAVVAVAAGAELLVLARDGEARPGPHSLGRAGRFVVDHATCPVLLLPVG